MKQNLASLLVIALFAAACSLSTGCTSVGVTTNCGPNMVVIQNSGCFLFSAIPLFSGDPRYPNEEVCNWFENTVKLETNVRLLEEEAYTQHARGYRNITSHLDEEKLFWFILKRKIYRTSAELIKD